MTKYDQNLENVLTNGRQTARKLHTSAFDTLCLRGVKEVEKRIDEKETTKLDERSVKNEYVSSKGRDSNDDEKKKKNKY